MKDGNIFRGDDKRIKNSPTEENRCMLIFLSIISLFLSFFLISNIINFSMKIKSKILNVDSKIWIIYKIFNDFYNQEK